MASVHTGRSAYTAFCSGLLFLLHEVVQGPIECALLPEICLNELEHYRSDYRS